MKRAVVLLALVMAACGGGSDGQQALEKAADKLHDVRSGELHFRVTASTLSAADREVGFDLKGPFALAHEKGALPKVRFAYTDLLGRDSKSTTFVSTGDRAFVVEGGRTTPVPDAAVAHLRGKADTEAAAALGGLRIDEWARSPKVEGDTVIAEVDAAKALNDVFGVAASVGAEGGSFPHIEGDDAERLQRSVRGSRLEVTTTGERVLRSLRLVLDLAPAEGDQARLAELLGRFGGARLSVAIDLDKVNQPVEVQAP